MAVPDAQRITSPFRALLRRVGAAIRGPARTLDEVREVAYLDLGDRGAKLGRFGLLLFLSAVVASAGVLGDSTATVIGAMIIAPLAVPIQGIAVAIVAGEPRRLTFSFLVLLAGSAATIAIGALMAWRLPELAPLSQNSQVTGRTSPSTIDLYAAAATGLAGALGIARKDVSDILPGVAIAISLVPPLAVVGVTMADGDFAGAFGAFVLFATNVLAIIVMCGLLFWGLGYHRSSAARSEFRRRRAYLLIGSIGFVVLAVLGLLTLRAVQLREWTQAAAGAATTWTRGTDDTVTDVYFDGDALVIAVEGLPGGSVREGDLLRLLRGRVPAGTPVVLDRRFGDRRDLGDVP